MPVLLQEASESTALNPELMNMIEPMSGDGDHDDFKFNNLKWGKVEDGCG